MFQMFQYQMEILINWKFLLVRLDEFDFIEFGRWIRFHDVIEKIRLQNETFNKKEMCMQKSLINLVKIYEKDKILDVFLKSCIEIFKSWIEVLY